MPLVGFEPTIPANARPHTYALDRAASGDRQRQPIPVVTSSPLMLYIEITAVYFQTHAKRFKYILGAECRILYH
jgi:hypothetical protein